MSRARVGEDGQVRFASYAMVNDGEVTSAVYVLGFQVGRTVQNVLVEAGYLGDADFDELWVTADQAVATAAERVAASGS
ncbi:MAG: hypothetical protein JJU45_13575 [Acidimicrobiia bacterium]|nr:hypothetical protein [Acidimicrobiia bacterium]